ncbi:MAG: rhomboid family intramembrane serine protease [Rhodospirillales bacterium]|nr:rhomboid family intramembrane serine protease [Rhodospirillales bacterium]
MLIPLKDDNPLKRIPYQYVTVALIGLCVIVFLWQLSLGEAGGRKAVLGFGAIPSVLFGSRTLPMELAMIPAPLTLITSMFMHGGWMHLIGNLLFLWVLGDNVEDAMGHGRFFVFYILCGLAAALTHAGLDPDSTTPMIGASGAISGVIGAYLILHPKAQILTLAFRFFIHIPAYIMLGIWIAMQVINVSMAADSGGGGVAWWAHIGGLIAGCILIAPMRHKSVPLFAGFSNDSAQPEPEEAAPTGPWGRLTPGQAKDHKKRRARRSFIPDSGSK